MYKKDCLNCGVTFTTTKKSKKFCCGGCFGSHRAKLYKAGLKTDGAELNANSNP